MDETEKTHLKTVTRKARTKEGYSFEIKNGLKITVYSLKHPAMASLRQQCSHELKTPSYYFFVVVHLSPSVIIRAHIGDQFRVLNALRKLNPAYFWLLCRVFFENREIQPLSPTGIALFHAIKNNVKPAVARLVYQKTDQLTRKVKEDFAESLGFKLGERSDPV